MAKCQSNREFKQSLKNGSCRRINISHTNTRHEVKARHDDDWLALQRMHPPGSPELERETERLLESQRLDRLIVINYYKWVKSVVTSMVNETGNLCCTVYEELSLNSRILNK
jgi:hypothetical protein